MSSDGLPVLIASSLPGHGPGCLTLEGELSGSEGPVEAPDLLIGKSAHKNNVAETEFKDETMNHCDNSDDEHPGQVIFTGKAHANKKVRIESPTSLSDATSRILGYPDASSDSKLFHECRDPTEKGHSGVVDNIAEKTNHQRDNVIPQHEPYSSSDILAVVDVNGEVALPTGGVVSEHGTVMVTAEQINEVEDVFEKSSTDFDADANQSLSDQRPNLFSTDYLQENPYVESFQLKQEVNDEGINRDVEIAQQASDGDLLPGYSHFESFSKDLIQSNSQRIAIKQEQLDDSNSERNIFASVSDNTTPHLDVDRIPPLPRLQRSPFVSLEPLPVDDAVQSMSNNRGCKKDINDTKKATFTKFRKLSLPKLPRIKLEPTEQTEIDYSENSSIRNIFDVFNTDQEVEPENCDVDVKPIPSTCEKTINVGKRKRVIYSTLKEFKDKYPGLYKGQTSPVHGTSKNVSFSSDSSNLEPVETLPVLLNNVSVKLEPIDLPLGITVANKSSIGGCSTSELNETMDTCNNDSNNIHFYGTGRLFTRNNSSEDYVPDFDEIDDIMFISFGTQDSLEAHVEIEKQTQQPRNKHKDLLEDISHFKTNSSKSKQKQKKKKAKRGAGVNHGFRGINNKILLYERMLCEELSKRKHHQTIHPDLKKAGITRLSQSPAKRYNLAELGVNLDPPKSTNLNQTAHPANSKAKSTCRKKSSKSLKHKKISNVGVLPSKQSPSTSQSKPPDNDFDAENYSTSTHHPSLTADPDKWRLPESESKPFKPFELPVTSKTSAFVSKELDEYLDKLQNTSSILTESTLTIKPVSYFQPDKPQSYVRTLDMVLKRRNKNNQVSNTEPPSHCDSLVYPSTADCGETFKSKPTHQKLSSKKKTKKVKKKAKAAPKKVSHEDSDDSVDSMDRMQQELLQQVTCTSPVDSASESSDFGLMHDLEHFSDDLVNDDDIHGFDVHKSNVDNQALPDCGKDYCKLGCLCRSIDGSKKVETGISHCRKVNCMFGCTCDFQESTSLKLGQSHPMYTFQGESGQQVTSLGTKDSSNTFEIMLSQNSSANLTRYATCARTRTYISRPRKKHCSCLNRGYHAHDSLKEKQQKQETVPVIVYRIPQENGSSQLVAVPAQMRKEPKTASEKLAQAKKLENLNTGTPSLVVSQDKVQGFMLAPIIAVPTPVPGQNLPVQAKSTDIPKKKKRSKPKQVKKIPTSSTDSIKQFQFTNSLLAPMQKMNTNTSVGYVTTLLTGPSTSTSFFEAAPSSVKTVNDNKNGQNNPQQISMSAIKPVITSYIEAAPSSFKALNDNNVGRNNPQEISVPVINPASTLHDALPSSIKTVNDQKAGEHNPQLISVPIIDPNTQNRACPGQRKLLPKGKDIIPNTKHADLSQSKVLPNDVNIPVSIQSNISTEIPTDKVSGSTATKCLDGNNMVTDTQPSTQNSDTKGKQHAVDANEHNKELTDKRSSKDLLKSGGPANICSSKSTPLQKPVFIDLTEEETENKKSNITSTTNNVTNTASTPASGVSLPIERIKVKVKQTFGKTSSDVVELPSASRLPHKKVANVAGNSKSANKALMCIDKVVRVRSRFSDKTWETTSLLVVNKTSRDKAHPVLIDINSNENWLPHKSAIVSVILQSTLDETISTKAAGFTLFLFYSEKTRTVHLKPGNAMSGKHNVKTVTVWVFIPKLPIKLTKTVEKSTFDTKKPVTDSYTKDDTDDDDCKIIAVFDNKTKNIPKIVDCTSPVEEIKDLANINENEDYRAESSGFASNVEKSVNQQDKEPISTTSVSPSEKIEHSTISKDYNNKVHEKDTESFHCRYVSELPKLTSQRMQINLAKTSINETGQTKVPEISSSNDSETQKSEHKVDEDNVDEQDYSNPLKTCDKMEVDDRGDTQMADEVDVDGKKDFQHAVEVEGGSKDDGMDVDGNEDLFADETAMDGKADPPHSNEVEMDGIEDPQAGDDSEMDSVTDTHTADESNMDGIVDPLMAEESQMDCIEGSQVADESEVDGQEDTVTACESAGQLELDAVEGTERIDHLEEKSLEDNENANEAEMDSKEDLQTAGGPRMEGKADPSFDEANIDVKEVSQISDGSEMGGMENLHTANEGNVDGMQDAQTGGDSKEFNGDHECSNDGVNLTTSDKPCENHLLDSESPDETEDLLAKSIRETYEQWHKIINGQMGNDSGKASSAGNELSMVTEENRKDASEELEDSLKKTTNVKLEENSIHSEPVSDNGSNKDESEELGKDVDGLDVNASKVIPMLPAKDIEMLPNDNPHLPILSKELIIDHDKKLTDKSVLDDSSGNDDYYFDDHEQCIDVMPDIDDLNCELPVSKQDTIEDVNSVIDIEGNSVSLGENSEEQKCHENKFLNVRRSGRPRVQSWKLISQSEPDPPKNDRSKVSRTVKKNLVKDSKQPIEVNTTSVKSIKESELDMIYAKVPYIDTPKTTSKRKRKDLGVQQGTLDQQLQRLVAEDQFEQKQGRSKGYKKSTNRQQPSIVDEWRLTDEEVGIDVAPFKENAAYEDEFIDVEGNYEVQDIDETSNMSDYSVTEKPKKGKSNPKSWKPPSRNLICDLASKTLHPPSSSPAERRKKGAVKGTFHDISQFLGEPQFTESVVACLDNEEQQPGRLVHNIKERRRRQDQSTRFRALRDVCFTNPSHSSKIDILTKAFKEIQTVRDEASVLIRTKSILIEQNNLLKKRLRSLGVTPEDLINIGDFGQDTEDGFQSASSAEDLCSLGSMTENYNPIEYTDVCSLDSLSD